MSCCIDARRGRFDVVLVWASDRLARSVRHFLEVLDELNHLGIEFVSFRENIDTGGPLGRAVVVIIGAIAELERNLIVERVRAGMRRAKLEGRAYRPQTARRRPRRRAARPCPWQSLTQIAKSFRTSRATVSRLLKQAKEECYEHKSNSRLELGRRLLAALLSVHYRLSSVDYTLREYVPGEMIFLGRTRPVPAACDGGADQ